MLPITVHRTTHPRAWGSAAAAALVAGLAAATVAVNGPGESSSRAVVADAIALRPDPADPSRLVVDFGSTASGGAFDPSTYPAVPVDLGQAGSDRAAVARTDPGGSG